MKHSEHINEIAAALAKAQGEMKNPHAEATNNFQKYSYAKASDFLNTIREPLTRNNISFMIDVELLEGNKIMILMLSHASGQWMKFSMPLQTDLEPGKGMSYDQTWGSHLTYRKKSLISLVFGIHGDEDDDDGSSTHEKTKKYEKLSAEQVKQLLFEIGKHTDIAQKLLETYNINELIELPKEHYTGIMQRIRTTVNARKQ